MTAAAAMSGEAIEANGIDADTGDYLLPALSVEDIAKVAQRQTLDPSHLSELKYRRNTRDLQHMGVVEGVDPKNLAEAGWGVIFAHADSDRVDALKEALSELLAWRRQQAGERYREYFGVGAYRPGESKTKFLARHGMGPGPADPEQVPYYLLLVGSPQEIPYRFQYQLDVQYAVGRIHFDSFEEYAHYARSVVAAEKGEVRRQRAVSFFSPQNPGDRATLLGTRELVAPLAAKLAARKPAGGSPWRVDKLLKDDATKARLAGILNGDSEPAVVFTASHGVGFSNGSARQLPHQGALLCQDWPGLEWGRRPIPEKHYFSADDVTTDARLAGLVSLHFACYGAGTPRLDDFPRQAFKERREIAPSAFVSRLPQRMLSHPRGGALAAIGHVERAWGCSFMWQGTGQLGVFESAIERLLTGHPVGSAMEPFNQRYAELAADLAEELEEIEYGKVPDPLALASQWTANNDARSYVVVGDPAVRLATATDDPQVSSP